MAPGRAVRRRCSGSVSRRPSTATHASTNAATARTTNTPRQLVTPSTRPPMLGARTGAMPVTSISRDSSVAAAEPGEQVAHDGHRDDGDGGGREPLQEPGAGQQGDARGQGAEHGGEQVAHHPGDQRAASAHGVGERADDELADAEADQHAGDRGLRRRLGGGQVGGEVRQGGQVHVDRQRSERGERAEDEHQLQVATPGQGRAGGFRGRRRGCRRGRRRGSSSRTSGLSSRVVVASSVGRAGASQAGGVTPTRTARPRLRIPLGRRSPVVPSRSLRQSRSGPRSVRDQASSLASSTSS